MTIDPQTVFISKGSHHSPDQGLCLMELSAYIAGVRHSDGPPCVASLFAAALRRWNDRLDDAARQDLRRYATSVIGTAADRAVNARRAWLMADWAVRVCLPGWLDAADRRATAELVRGLPTLTDFAALARAQACVANVRAEAYADPRRRDPGPGRRVWDYGLSVLPIEAVEVATWGYLSISTVDADWTATIRDVDSAIHTTSLLVGAAVGEATAVAMQASYFEMFDRAIAMKADAS